ncbi:phospholipase A-2-activating protein, partial [Phenoliferia sp. Uapishka_3]
MSVHEDNSGPQKFRLSALLEGHTDDVRALACDSSSRLFSASRDGTARSWTQKGLRTGRTGGWEQDGLFGGHQGFVNSVTWWGGNSSGAGDSNPGYLITGGQDSLINVFDLAAADLSSVPTLTLSGHSSNVCALHAVGDFLVSGSWDCTARVWNIAKNWECERILEGHRAAVWDVLALKTAKYEGAVITACADGLIRLFKPESQTASVIFKGHTEPVRALAKVLPEDPLCVLFASCSNDGSVIIWNYAGNSITTLAGHKDSFIYALVSISAASGGGMASSGEEGIVKVWDEEEGDEEQEIIVPALSVWSLASLPNGDLAIADSDNLIWVFTRDASRAADSATTSDYEKRLANRPKPAAKNAAKPPLPIVDASILEAEGSKDGEVKLVEVDGKVHAYQWNGGEWADLGEVTGQEPTPEANGQSASSGSKKMSHDGVAYDFVIDIDVSDDKPALKLPFNLEGTSLQLSLFGFTIADCESKWSR